MVKADYINRKNLHFAAGLLFALVFFSKQNLALFYAALFLLPYYLFTLGTGGTRLKKWRFTRGAR